MEYLSDGITDSLINSLSEIKRLRVVARSLAFRYKGREVDPQSAGRELGVRAVLAGRVLLRGDTLVIGTELLNVDTGSQIWGAQYRRKFEDIFAIEEEVAREISEKLRLQLSGEEKKRLTKRATQNKEAYQLYLKALYFLNRGPEEHQKAVEYVRQAIDADPGSAPSYAVLAHAYGTLGFFNYVPAAEAFPKAKAAALKALELDERLPDAHASLAMTRLFYDWDWAGTDKEIRRALELNPDHPLSLVAHGYYLLFQGRLQEALAEAKRALDLDPLSFLANHFLGAALLAASEYGRAVDQFRKTVELNPNLPTRSLLVMAYALQGRHEEAMAACQTLSALPRGSVPSRVLMGYCYALAGKVEEARSILEELNNLPEKGSIATYYTAILHAALHEPDPSFELLNKLCDERFGFVLGIKCFPFLDPLSSDPRFGDLLRRVGLPQ